MGSSQVTLMIWLRWISTVSVAFGFVLASENSVFSEDPKKTTPEEFDLPRLVRAIVEPEFRFLGNNNCGATACHGGASAGVSDQFAPRGSEYPLFVERDPHARSWTTLCSEKSSLIMSKLGIISEKGLLDSRGFENCLACHAQPSAEVTEVVNAFDLNRSIGCESCHGPAEKWSSTHFRTPASSATKDGSDRLEYQGKVDTKALLTRARLCVTCHVGARDRDMNHDIIAAGHPALYFEMATQHDHLPKHWREEIAEKTSDEYRARMWLAGQLASADAELELLERRISPERQNMWPELAVYDCAKCHFQLRVEPNPASLSKRVDQGGAFRVRRWNITAFDTIIRYSVTSTRVDEKEFDRCLKASRELIEGLERGITPSTQIVVQLRKDLGRLAIAWGGESVQGWGSLDQRRLALELIDSGLKDQDWESAMQAYLAARTALPRPVDRSDRDLFEELKSQLEFSPKTQSPRRYNQKKDGTQQASEQTLPELLQELKRQIAITSSPSK